MTTLPLCVDCDKPVDPLHDENCLNEVRGWERKRLQGGQNHVRFREETGRFMCGSCATKRTYAGHPSQGVLEV
jgi:hypothetical protein